MEETELRQKLEELEAQIAALQARQVPRWRRMLAWFAAHRSARHALSIALIGIPVAAYATTIAIPHVFSNGTVADAVEVNANFDTLVVESNAQDTRIAALEANGGDISAVIAGSGLTGGGASGAVTLNVAVGGITALHLAANSVDSSRIVDGSVTSSDIAANTITAVDIAASAIGTSEIASNAVGAAEISTNAVGSSEIADGSIQTLDIALGAVQSFNILDGTIVGSDIASNAVGAIQIATDAVGSSEIAAGAVASLEILDNSITGVDVSTSTSLTLGGLTVNGATNLGGIVTVLGSISASAQIESVTGGFRFPDASVQTTAASVFPNRLLVAPSGGDFASIQAAIDSVTPMASSPWLIEIAAGTYTEELTLKSYLHLKGAGVESTIIQPSTSVLHHVTATSVVGVKLSSLTLEDEQATGPSAERAIALSGSEIEIEDVRITGYTTELINASSSTLTVRRSDFLDPLFDLDRGIYLFQSSAIITESTLNTRDCAIDADRSDLTLTRSVVSFELCARGSESPPRAILVSQNRIASIHISGTARAEIVGNEIRGDTGGNVNIDSSEPGQLVGNIIDFTSTSTSTAVVVTGFVAVVGNQVRNTSPDGTGILNLGTAQIVGNTFDVSGTAIVDLQDGLIVANSILGSPMTAISGSANSVLMGNRVPPGYSTDTEERWLSSRKIRVESTSQGIEFEAGGSTVTLAPSGDITIQAAGDLNLAGTNVNISAAVEIDLSAGTVVDVNGGLITLN